MKRKSHSSFESIIIVNDILCEVYFHYVSTYNTFLVTFYPPGEGNGVSHVMVYNRIKDRWMSLESADSSMIRLFGDMIERELTGEES